MRRFSRPALLSREEMDEVARAARQSFREERIAKERLWSESYSAWFDEALSRAEHVLAATSNLKRLEGSMADLLAEGYLDILRYMTCPTVSSDDFKNVADVGTLSAQKLASPDLAGKAASYLCRNLNLSLFPWMKGSTEPCEEDVAAASKAVAALVADQKTKTAMRNEPSRSQEETVRRVLVKRADFELVPSHDISTLADAPRPGQVFDKETSVGGVRADVVLGLYDGRFMALECKVSNSGVNSYKRLNHEVTDKVEKWHAMFGMNGVVGGCVLQGIYETENLMSAQQAGVSIFWSRDLEKLLTFVDRTRQEFDGR